MDIGSIAAAVASLKTAGDIAKSLLELRTLAEVQAKAMDLNGKIIDAQHQVFAANAAQTTLVERVRDLESQIARMKDWETEKKRYRMSAPATGAVVYALQREMSSGEPPHYLCANCFKQGKPSLLSDLPDLKAGTSMHYWMCSACGSKSGTGFIASVSMKYAEDIPVPK